MEYLNLILIPLSAAFQWLVDVWSADEFLMNLLLSLFFVGLVIKFFVVPLLGSDAGSDRADKKPKKSQNE